MNSKNPGHVLIVVLSMLAVSATVGVLGGVGLGMYNLHQDAKSARVLAAEN